jgi:Flp pilus assembly protein TadG
MTTQRNGTSGAAMAELVILAPLLLLLLLGLVEAGRAGNLALTVAGAARAGVQYGAQNHTTAADTAGMQTAATNDANLTGVTAVASSFCLCEDMTASTCGATGVCSTNHQNLYVKLVVNGTETSLLNYAALPAGLRTVSVQTSATMRVAQ